MTIARTLINQLRSLDYDSMPISDYNRCYIRRMLPVLDYYFEIYVEGLRRLLRRVKKPVEEITLVDYGGGHGFLSLLAKQMGIGQVIYLDFNPDSAATIQVVSDCLSLSTDPGNWSVPDVILTGDAQVLKLWCKREGVVPDIVMGMDVIEHIYCLDDLFTDLFAIAPRMQLLFTTASNPYNPLVVHRLHRIMKHDELGLPAGSLNGFRQKRRAFIAKHNPQFSSQQLDYWADYTRGLNYDDVLRAVDSESPNLLKDPYNTCDPETGSWTERILPMNNYRSLVQPYGYDLHVRTGFYNSRHRGLKGLWCRWCNAYLKLNRGRSLAPFLFLYLRPVAPEVTMARRTDSTMR